MDCRLRPDLQNHTGVNDRPLGGQCDRRHRGERPSVASPATTAICKTTILRGRIGNLSYN